MSESCSAEAAGRFRVGDRTVARLGFGTMRLTGTQAFHAGEPRDRDGALAVLRRAIDLGVDHFDTAAFYFSRTRSAPELVNAALAGLSPSVRDAVTVATKVGPVRDVHGEWAERPTPEQLRGHVEELLRLLGRDVLDVVYFRTGGSGTAVAAHVQALADLVGEGLVRHVGVSGVELDQLEEARAVTEVVAVQNRFSVEEADSGDFAVLDRCAALGIAFVPYFTVSGRGRQGQPGTEPDGVIQVAAELGATPAQVRLAWALALGDHVCVIPGTASVAHLEQNVAAAALRLTDGQLRRLASHV